MHESDAQWILAEVLRGFLRRNFPINESENPDIFEVHLAKYQAFIRDREAYWMKEKMVTLIEAQNEVELGYREGPQMDTPASGIDRILSTAEIQLLVDVKRRMDDKGVIIRFPFPSPLPPRK